MKTPAPEHRRNAARVKNESGGMKLGGNTPAVCPRLVRGGSAGKVDIKNQDPPWPPHA